MHDIDIYLNTMRGVMKGMFKGKTTVVTGASRGIGRRILLDVVENGGRVIGIYHRSQEKASEVEKEAADMNGEAIMVQCDVSDPSAVESTARAISRNHGPVSILVNNAGIHQHLDFWNLSVEDWKKVLETNLTSQFTMTKGFADDLKKSEGGRVVNISSCIAYMGTDHEVHYAASKGGTVSLTKSLALELAPWQVTVNAVAPGYVETDMLEFDNDAQRRHHEGKIPLKRFGKPKDISNAVQFLCSPKAAYITGQILHVNGGLLMA